MEAEQWKRVFRLTTIKQRSGCRLKKGSDSERDKWPS